MANEPMNKLLGIAGHRKAHLTSQRDALAPTGTATIKRPTTSGAGRNEASKPRALVPGWQEWEGVRPLWRRLAVAQKVHTELPYHPQVHSWEPYPRERQTHVRTQTARSSLIQHSARVGPAVPMTS